MKTAIAYNNLIGFGKKVCILLLLICLATILLPLADISLNKKKSQIISQNDHDATIKEFIVQDPEFNMIDAEKNKYQVVAKKAQEQKNEVLLQSPKTSVYFLNNTQLKIFSTYGTWYQLAKILKINHNVSINYDQNYQANTNSMVLDIANNLIYSNESIIVNSNLAHLTASGFKAYNEDQKIYFLGPIKLIIKENKDHAASLITAKKLMIDQKQNVAIFTGEVVLTQTNSITKADEMFVYHLEKEINKIKSIGNVYIINDTQIAKADQAEYIIKAETIELLGEVSLKNGNNIIKGDHLIYNISTGIGKIIPAATSKQLQVKAILRE